MKLSIHKLTSTFQRYTFFGKSEWKLLIPLFSVALTRSVLLGIYDDEFQVLSIIRMFVFSFLNDSLLFLLGLALTPKRINKVYYFFFLLYLVCSNLIFIHHVKIYYKAPGLGAIAALFETTPLEAVEFTRITNIGDLLFTALLALIPVFVFLMVKREYLVKVKIIGTSVFITLSILFLVLIYLIFGGSINKSLTSSVVIQDFKNVYHYGSEYFKLKKLKKKRIQKTFNAYQSSKMHEYAQTHIVVIGESLSKNHMGIYGYRRNTTPKLSLVKNLTLFDNVISPSTQTRSSIVRMLTTSFGLNTSNFYKQGSIITAMKDANFKTYWLSNQSRYGLSDTETTLIADDSDETIFVNNEWQSKSLDEKVLEKLEEILSEPKNHKLIIIHLLGSHFEYTKRFPKNGKFLLDNTNFPEHNNPDEIKRINEYDATVKYSDFVLDSIIKILDHSSDVASLVFVSDHGEEVYDDERNLLGHGSPLVTKNTVEIPFILWESSDFKSIRNLKDQKDNRKRFYNNGNFFHSLCDLWMLNFEEFENDRSIFNLSKNRYEYPYIINSNQKKINYFQLK